MFLLFFIICFFPSFFVDSELPANFLFQILEKVDDFLWHADRFRLIIRMLSIFWPFVGCFCVQRRSASRDATFWGNLFNFSTTNLLVRLIFALLCIFWPLTLVSVAEEDETSFLDRRLRPVFRGFGPARDEADGCGVA